MRHLSSARTLALAPARRGMTLIELMIGLAISAVLALAAAPYFGDYVANSRLREGGNTLFAQTLLAQSEALKRNGPVQVQVNGGEVSLLDVSGGGAGTVIRQVNLPTPVAAAANASFVFASDGRLQPMNPVALDLVIPGSACTADRRCPGLRVDAGGAVRLCGDSTGGCP